MTEEKKIGTMIRTRDPSTLEMEYAVGLKESEARDLRALLHGPEWSRLAAKLEWVIEVAESDRAAKEAKAEAKPDEVP